MSSRRIAVLVSNDLVHDQRVRKTCEVLVNSGLQPVLVGRLLADSGPLEREYEVLRLKLPYDKGAKFYAALQWALRKWLRSERGKLVGIWANDLDTLWPAYTASKRQKIPLIYDSHEYFTEAAGLTGRPFPKFVWERIEGAIFPHLKHVFTVNESIAEIYRNKYKVDVKVLRNVPLLREHKHPPLTRQELQLPEGKLIILQGAFMDKDRGVVDAVKAMQHLKNVHLLLVGAGEEWETAKCLRTDLKLEEKVTILPKQPYDKLVEYTRTADAGLSLDKGVHFNYYYSLPNKIFDYIHAGIPVIASPLPEVSKVVEANGVGLLIDDWEPLSIAGTIAQLLERGKGEFNEALQTARVNYNWQRESEGIRKMLEEAGLLNESVS